jgi:16S rRNA (uracil1498-N3)-methyltransferase
MMSHKKIHRFLVNIIPPSKLGDKVTITDARVAKQVNRVLKIRPGEEIQIFMDESPEYTLALSETTDFSLTGKITAIAEVAAPARMVIAAVSIVKGDAFEMMVQKLTEIGAHTIVPLITHRTIKQNVRLNRLQAISDEAVEQCGATRRVHIADPITLQECFEQYPFDSVVLDPIATNTKIEFRAASENYGEPSKIVCYVGPEGGWNEQDEEIIKSFAPQHLRITDRVLRTETAAILGAFMLLWQ